MFDLLDPGWEVIYEERPSMSVEDVCPQQSHGGNGKPFLYKEGFGDTDTLLTAIVPCTSTNCPDSTVGTNHYSNRRDNKDYGCSEGSGNTKRGSERTEYRLHFYWQEH